MGVTKITQEENGGILFVYKKVIYWMILDNDPVVQIIAAGKLPENADPAILERAINQMNSVPSGITINSDAEEGLIYIYASIIPNCFILKETFPVIASYFSEAQSAFYECYDEETKKSLI